ncbi:MAG: rRNA maturation RNase YbeY [candidate division WOR-3 bacterium]|nr:rRNA maturation RNase YbeY [candidate division WOR-3 bacterium]
MKILIWGITNKNSISKYKKFAKSILSVFGNKKLIGSTDVLNIVFVNDAYIKELNKRFLKRNYPTDVLAFPIKMNIYERTGTISDNVWGEIYISKDRAKEQAKELKIKVNDEICNLIKHGILHLLGYSHKDMQLTKE